MVEQAEILEDHADLAPEAREFGLAVLAHILAEQGHAAARRLQRLHHQLHQGCLAGTRRAGQELETLGRDRKVDIAENFRPDAIAQADILETHEVGLGRFRPERKGALVSFREIRHWLYRPLTVHGER